jgi:hypothetical protein
MKAGSRITGNSSSSESGGVYVSGGTFNMSGGTVSRNMLSEPGARNPLPIRTTFFLFFQRITISIFPTNRDRAEIIPALPITPSNKCWKKKSSPLLAGIAERQLERFGGPDKEMRGIVLFFSGACLKTSVFKQA